MNGHAVSASDERITGADLSVEHGPCDVVIGASERTAARVGGVTRREDSTGGTDR